MPDNPEDDTYLLEIMASHAALAFRPELPKAKACNCEAKVSALTTACNEMTEEFRKSREISRESTALAFTAGVMAGIAATFLKRKR